MKDAQEVFDFIPGIWKIIRKIKFPLSQEKEDIKVEGYAAFIKSQTEPNVVMYSEKVVVYNLDPTQKLNGRKTYKYKYDDKNSTLSKYFSDDQLFYKLAKGFNHNYNGQYQCNQDYYKSNYSFGHEQFTLTYFVRGPEKFYDIVTQYTKVDVSLDDLQLLGITIENYEII